MIGRMYRACLLTPIVLWGSIPSVPATDNSIRLGNLLISVESLSTVDTAPRPFSTGTAARKATEGYRLVQATVSVTNLGKHLVCTRLKSTLDAPYETTYGPFGKYHSGNSNFRIAHSWSRIAGQLISSVSAAKVVTSTRGHKTFQSPFL
jgi:hypothetical protein